MESVLVPLRCRRLRITPLLIVFVAGMLSIRPGPARGDIVATADIQMVVNIATPVYSATISFDPTTYMPFGVPTTFDSSVGQSSISGAYVFPTLDSGTFDQVFASDTPGNLEGSATGAYLCNGLCSNGASFVGTFSTIAGTALAGLPADAVYTFDGLLDPVVADGIYWYSSGRLTINAFRPVATASSPPGCSGAGCAVAVSQLVTFGFPDGTTGSANVVITYPNVVSGGQTTVSALSDVDGDLPSDVAIEVGGYRAAFLELQTTAGIDTSGGPIEVCISYDLAGTGVVPSQLRFLHRESGVFVDRTSRIDETAGVVCGEVTSFSPVVLAAAVECSTNADCNDGSACTDDLCTAFGACLHTLPTGCAVATKAVLKTTDSTVPAKDKLSFSFAGAGTNFGSPTTTTGYAICVLDGSSTLQFAAEVPPGGLCDGKPCWSTKGLTSKFKSKSGAPDGITTLTLKGTTSGSAKIVAKGKGANLTAPGTPLAPTVTAFVRRLDAAACWGATFSAPSKNANGTFTAKN